MPKPLANQKEEETAWRESASQESGGTPQVTSEARINLSRIVDHAELKKNDDNISPSRYINTSDAETYRPIAEIVDELDAVELEAKERDQQLRKILKQLGVGS